jgi:hypothetical protein
MVVNTTPWRRCATLLQDIGSFRQFLALFVTVSVMCVSLHANGASTPTPTPTPMPSPSPDPSRLVNISTRVNVGVNDAVLIGGFIVQGSQPKRMILRAIGPSLASQGVIGAMADPTLELHDSIGATIATNDNWQTNTQASEISSSGLAPSNPLESQSWQPFSQATIGPLYEEPTTPPTSP